VSMWPATMSRRIAWYASGLMTTILLIGGARSAMAQPKVEQASRGITLPHIENALDQSIPESISVGGVTRTYRLYVPSTFEPGDSALIIVLHGRGAGGRGSAMEQYSQLDLKADQEGFAVAYLDGLVDATGTLNWNYYYDFFFTSGPDDVAFIRSVIDLLKQQLRPNSNVTT
jgi:poly(3-hydroxybutyrate) depolymerase